MGNSEHLSLRPVILKHYSKEQAQRASKNDLRYPLVSYLQSVCTQNTQGQNSTYLDTESLSTSVIQAPCPHEAWGLLASPGT
jgi:hypothetical protein